MPSTLQEANIQDMVERGILPEKQISGWRCCYKKEFPSEDRTEMVVFRSFDEKGFALPAGAFFHGLEVTHLKPNSIAQIAIFIHLCEGYLGIAPHFNLWQVLYRLKGHPSSNHCNVVGRAAFSLRQGRTHPDLTLHNSNKGWNKEWFMVSNPAPLAPSLDRTRVGVPRVLGAAVIGGRDGPGGAPY